jgi:hypothetical protein
MPPEACASHIADIKSGDGDHFVPDLRGNRLFLIGEVNKSIEVFDLRTNKRIHSIKGVDTPHSMLFFGHRPTLGIRQQ